MLEIFSVILALILFSKFLEDRIKIPFVLIVIVLSYINRPHLKEIVIILKKRVKNS